MSVRTVATKQQHPLFGKGAQSPQALARPAGLSGASLGNYKRWLLALAAAAAVAFGAVALTGGIKVTVVRVERRDLVQKVVATGRVEPPARVRLGTLAPGLAVRVLADEGERVSAGQTLVELDRAEVEAAVQQARAGVAAAEARLAQLGTSSQVAAEALRQAEINLESANLELERAKALAGSGAGSRRDLDTARRAVDLARSQRESALARLASTSRGGSDALLASAELSRARAALAQAKARLDQTRVLAPADGIVLERNVEPGDVVQPGGALLVLARDGDTRLVAQPDEKSLAFLAPGQSARASADAFASRSFSARVMSIAPSVDPQRGTVEVKLSVPEPPTYLRADMTVSVDVEVARAARTLVVPAELVRDASGDRPWVLALRDGRAERREVELGIRGEGYVQILSGLAEGDELIPQDAKKVRPGQKVRRG